MTDEDAKKALIQRNLLFWLSGEPIKDPEKVLKQIALDCDATDSEVWKVYSEMVQAALGF